MAYKEINPKYMFLLIPLSFVVVSVALYINYLLADKKNEAKKQFVRSFSFLVFIGIGNIIAALIFENIINSKIIDVMFITIFWAGGTIFSIIWIRQQTSLFNSR